ncbi:uncharacterized protein LOC128362262 [Scomber japonicus]|uniref:uncharacterized protein LOC128362262 n=1 Tax=Scomber japonicus TaxID=13676 RepID=UPI002305E427|nr:uncharacterized protein LOC128362262 [Scomber japonicus]
MAIQASLPMILNKQADVVAPQQPAASQPSTGAGNTNQPSCSSSSSGLPEYKRRLRRGARRLNVDYCGSLRIPSVSSLIRSSPQPPPGSSSLTPLPGNFPLTSLVSAPSFLESSSRCCSNLTRTHKHKFELNSSSQLTFHLLTSTQLLNSTHHDNFCRAFTHASNYPHTFFHLVKKCLKQLKVFLPECDLHALRPPATTAPVYTSKEISPTTTPTNNDTDSQTTSNLTQTSLPITQSTTKENQTTAGSYTVTPFKTGFMINITNSPLGNYTIHVKEKDQNEASNEVFQHTNQNSLHYISNLKPCTVYEHNVTFSNASIETCMPLSNENTKTTNPMIDGDIKPVSCDPGSLCFNTDWNITSVKITANNIAAQVMPCRSDNKVFCIRPDFNDICTNLTTIFTAEKCGNSSFNFTHHISAGM